MAYTSAPRSGVQGRIASAATTLYSDNQSLIAEIRKATIMMKEIGVDFEKDNESDMVKQLEDGVINLVKASDECTHLSSAIQSIGKEYQPAAELTNFSKLFDKKIKRSMADTSSDSQSRLWLRQFREAIWKVHHDGQPMPGEEQDDIVMTSTECNLLNTTCPLTGKPITELAEPVRSMDCKHIYEKNAIMQHLRSKAATNRCPVTACPKILLAGRVVCDPFLVIEIDEMRSLNAQRVRADAIEDFTQLEDH
ncbi:E3 SUMO-protein ligase MMS21-like isoform X2 [Salvia miltiorrhiza]|uniref:E3 SUMO-protein ligase MMS21-like isoform X2 n=1 Tax=Salvia miltiorrhiza TaxID=226208 RepID=UPI0025AC3C26|nr:E3 SUMO-protein ligase MMS21-like isoform X2 [Salvia miltiorrhiza]XP_057804800.1 E3 SUMO-protein ligase MMS21-like isoform X2 [Salvia miltiorrhiza]XP_057804801.1 E3 SUMO-protein ligase MMS21-like isoform X2 [Salvia miltiorrhiza]XP_057804907.1 E3 SUMO-protein ligase MMS21-like isoform X2 [Salvia miltiorrhiza]XP_057804908.1 E3 SUMO-protein ligase MMS21-like isoform X2 [Salvia miltiorrhiza]